MFATNGIDLDKKSNKEYIASQEKMDIDIKINLNLRECLLGE